LFSFSAWNTSLHALLAIKFSIKKPTVILMGLPLYVIFLSAFHIFFLFFLLIVLTII
jgi:hypothetical protein